MLRYVLTALCGDGCTPRFDIISGTSVGAINGCYLAANAHVPDYNIDGLAEIWSSLALRDYLHLHTRELVQVLTSVLGVGSGWRRFTTRRYTGGRLGGLLNTQSLDHLVRGRLINERISENVKSGAVGTLTVSATEVATGRTICFVESRAPLPDWSRDTPPAARPTRIRAEHALASAAIPFLFPAVEIDGAFYCDGSLRQPTPLSPALRLGAERVLVIALRADLMEDMQMDRETVERTYPSALFLFGKLLNALLLDPVQYDMAVLEPRNRFVIHGRRVYGPSFEEELNRVVEPLRGKPYRIVDDILIRPSHDIGRVAADVANGLTRKQWGYGPAAQVFRRFARSEGRTESDLLSYLLFEGVFCDRLIQHGYEDAARHHDELLRFFSDEPLPR